MKLIPNSLSRSVGRQILTIKKNSPRTMFVLGIVGVGASTVLACRATLKLEKELEKFQERVDDVKYEGLDRTPVVKEDGYNKELARAYVAGSYCLVKLYAPAVIAGSASIGLLTGSHVTLTRRNAALTAAYSALQLSFDQYMQRVAQEIGPDRERDIHHAVTNTSVTIDGKKEVIPVADPNSWSPYARMFDVEIGRAHV